MNVEYLRDIQFVGEISNTNLVSDCAKTVNDIIKYTKGKYPVDISISVDADWITENGYYKPSVVNVAVECCFHGFYDRDEISFKWSDYNGDVVLCITNVWGHMNLRVWDEESKYGDYVTPLVVFNVTDEWKKDNTEYGEPMTVDYTVIDLYFGMHSKNDESHQGLFGFVDDEIAKVVSDNTAELLRSNKMILVPFMTDDHSIVNSIIETKSFDYSSYIESGIDTVVISNNSMYPRYFYNTRLEMIIPIDVDGSYRCNCTCVTDYGDSGGIEYTGGRCVRTWNGIVRNDSANHKLYFDGQYVAKPLNPSADEIYPGAIRYVPGGSTTPVYWQRLSSDLSLFSNPGRLFKECCVGMLYYKKVWDVEAYRFDVDHVESMYNTLTFCNGKYYKLIMQR